MHNRLKTNEELARRHVITDSSCIRCGQSREDALHAVRDCVDSKRSIWLALLPKHTSHTFFTLDLRAWIVCNLKNQLKITNKEDWTVVFGVTVWRLWYWRNQFVHAHKTCSLSNVIMEVNNRSEELFVLHKSLARQRTPKTERWICWQPPRWPFLKLNTDGALKSSGLASAGGLVRNYCGEWVCGFSMNLGSCSIMEAELWGLYQGLKIAWERGFRLLQVEVDNLGVTQLLNSSEANRSGISSLLWGIKDLLNRDRQISVKHVYREANCAAHFLAGMALNLPLGCHIFHSPPMGVHSVLFNDGLGTAFARFV